LIHSFTGDALRDTFEFQEQSNMYPFPLFSSAVLSQYDKTDVVARVLLITVTLGNAAYCLVRFNSHHLKVHAALATVNLGFVAAQSLEILHFLKRSTTMSYILEAFFYNASLLLYIHIILGRMKYFKFVYHHIRWAIPTVLFINTALTICATTFRILWQLNVPILTQYQPKNVSSAWIATFSTALLCYKVTNFVVNYLIAKAVMDITLGVSTRDSLAECGAKLYEVITVSSISDSLGIVCFLIASNTRDDPSASFILYIVCRCGSKVSLGAHFSFEIAYQIFLSKAIQCS
jgi:hypothetical protein